jgi:hypothetical protein
MTPLDCRAPRSAVLSSARSRSFVTIPNDEEPVVHLFAYAGAAYFAALVLTRRRLLK